MKLYLLAGTLTVLLGAGIIASGSGLLSSSTPEATVPDLKVAAPVQLSNTAAPTTYGQSVAKLQTAELEVSGMYCISCAFIVRSVLEDVPGVRAAPVAFHLSVHFL